MRKLACMLLLAAAILTAGCPATTQPGTQPPHPTAPKAAKGMEPEGRTANAAIGEERAESKYVTVVYNDSKIDVPYGIMTIPKEWIPKAETAWVKGIPAAIYTFRAFSPDEMEGIAASSPIPLGKNRKSPGDILRDSVIRDYEKRGFTVELESEEPSDASAYQKTNEEAAKRLAEMGLPVIDEGESECIRATFRLRKGGEEARCLAYVPVMRGPAIRLPGGGVFLPGPNITTPDRTVNYSCHIFLYSGKDKTDEELESEMSRIMGTIRINEAWEQVRDEFIAGVTASTIKRRAKITENYVGMKNRIMDESRSLNREISDTNDRVVDMICHQIKETKIVISPFDGREIEVSSFPKHTYEASDGTIIQTDSEL